LTLDTSEYTASNGTSIVLNVAAGTGDIVDIIAFKSFTVADALSAVSGGTVNGAVTVTGALTTNGAFVAGGTMKGASTIGVGNATPSTSGAGITFPSTDLHYSTNANTLDDYEEGVFTPTISYSGSTSGIVYGSSRTGTYTKIGNVITVQLEVNVTNKGTGSGSVIVSLPFTNRAIRAGLAIGNTQGISANNSSYQAMVEVNLANVYFRVPSGLGGTTELGYADINNSFYVAMSGVYLIS